MGDQNVQAWALSGRQQNVTTRPQLLAIGFSPKQIKHRIPRGRLHPMWPGVYSVGTPNPSRLGWWKGAVLACGDDAALSHGDGSALLGLGRRTPGPIHVSVPASRGPKPKGVVVHRRADFATTERHGIPVTTPAWTI